MSNDKKLWGGRFTGSIDPLMKKYNDSLSYDKILFAEDILGSQIYAQHLVKCGILTEDEAKAICTGLSQIQTEWEAGEMDGATDEDIHSANERRLGEIIGVKTAGKLHTGRSRNDQVATDLRLWLRKKTTETLELLRRLILTLVRRAEDERHVLMPGYTHLQRAQPIRWAHWLLAYADFFASDLERLEQILPRINRMPLGVGAVAGHAFGIDRVSLAKELGFSSTIDNSLVAVADRDFIVEWLMWASLFMNHVSRMSEDLIIYSSSEFGFVKLSDAYSTGSSLMPQKRNPDALELLRGKSGRVFGHCSGFLMTTKGLPLSYNKDLQEDKEPLFDCVATCMNSVRIATGVIETLSINPSKMEAALTPDMLATDLAEYLVRKGVPFRESHHIVGSVVRLAEEKNTTISNLSLDEFRSCMEDSSSNCIGDDIFGIFNYKRSVESRNSRGGTSEQSVLDQIQRMHQRVGVDGNQV